MHVHFGSGNHLSHQQLHIHAPCDLLQTGPESTNPFFLNFGEILTGVGRSIQNDLFGIFCYCLVRLIDWECSVSLLAIWVLHPTVILRLKNQRLWDSSKMKSGPRKSTWKEKKHYISLLSPYRVSPITPYGVFEFTPIYRLGISGDYLPANGSEKFNSIFSMILNISWRLCGQQHQSFAVILRLTSGKTSLNLFSHYNGL